MKETHFVPPKEEKCEHCPLIKQAAEIEDEDMIEIIKIAIHCTPPLEGFPELPQEAEVRSSIFAIGKDMEYGTTIRRIKGECQAVKQEIK